MEAMASGLPIITSPNSGSVVRDGQEGFVSDYADTAAMVASVRRLTDDPEVRWHMGEAARQRACEFSLDRYSGELALILARLLSAKSGA
jgi:glycosyltransferase involved in cell wall biosynthesis